MATNGVIITEVVDTESQTFSDANKSKLKPTTSKETAEEIESSVPTVPAHGDLRCSVAKVAGLRM
ncbi:unnamed protein product [Plutella xylostella]|uniref:(diamondback moth) hypothetical protein n=1 Tax=Plutella xylostella TaxID=51655 RepID=A0A8S4E8A0_PLUXY|nr:unnamed protein product [Plutella xylostella]